MERIIAENFIKHIEDQFNSSYYQKNHDDAKRFFNRTLQEGFSASWSLGGTWGNCWGGKGTNPPDVEPEMTELDDFLIKHFPQTSYMQYKIIARKIDTHQSSDRDYYGGQSEKATKTLSFNDLHDALLEAKVVLETEDKVNFTEFLNQKLKDSFMTQADSEKEKNFNEQNKSVKAKPKKFQN